ncbi:MAG: tetraacyldisaccharide 4'-kinase, partial [Armatimonadetes bacterium]|nr:tetraacyldisaccharide 4'-kinase [Armatimonadota bacterium]
VGNPESFERTLEGLGAVLLGRARFADHHRYQPGDLRAILDGEGAAAEWIVTTRKDAVRLPREALNRPTWVLEVGLTSAEGNVPLAEELTCLLKANERT